MQDYKSIGDTTLNLTHIPAWFSELKAASKLPAPIKADETIIEGDRNNRLFKMGIKLLNQGFSELEIEINLQSINSRCVPPLPDDDIRTIVKSVMNYEPNIVFETELTEDFAAKLFISKYGHDFVWNKQQECWMHWNGSCWEPDVEYQLEKCIIDLSSLIIAECKKHGYEDKSEHKVWDARYKFATKLQQHSTLKSVENMIKYYVVAQTSDFDTNIYLLSCANGTLDLNSCKLRDFNQKDMISKRVNIAYNSGAACPRWLQFLKEVFVDDDLINYMHKLVGYCLTGDISERKFWVFHGFGNNGKSIFLTVLKALLGPYSVTATEHVFTESRNKSAINNDVAALKGSRVCISSEVDEWARFSESTIKNHTGGETVSARFLHHEFFEFKPTYKIFMAVNDKPAVTGTSAGLWNRLRLIPFEQEFIGDKADKSLEGKLLSELEGIFAWAVEGLKLYKSEGLKDIPKIIAANEDYKDESDDIQEFINSQCETGKECETPFSIVCMTYIEYAKKTGSLVYKNRHIKQRLLRMGIKIQRKTKSQILTCIGLKVKNINIYASSEPEF